MIDSVPSFCLFLVGGRLFLGLGDHHQATAPRHRQAPGTREPGGGIVGSRIEDDAAGLIRQLTEADRQAGCAVVAMVGPDGIGKTTLATKVYGNERVRRRFGARA